MNNQILVINMCGKSPSKFAVTPRNNPSYGGTSGLQFFPFYEIRKIPTYGGTCIVYFLLTENPYLRGEHVIPCPFTFIPWEKSPPTGEHFFFENFLISYCGESLWNMEGTQKIHRAKYNGIGKPYLQGEHEHFVHCWFLRRGRSPPRGEHDPQSESLQ